MVLQRLQQAIDLGVPLEDRGEGRFSSPTSALTALSTLLMPSLAQAVHEARSPARRARGRGGGDVGPAARAPAGRREGQARTFGDPG